MENYPPKVTVITLPDGDPHVYIQTNSEAFLEKLQELNIETEVFYIPHWKAMLKLEDLSALSAYPPQFSFPVIEEEKKEEENNGEEEQEELSQGGEPGKEEE